MCGQDADRRERIRNVVGFWCLGLCNNFSYVIMLSAAHDILKNPPGNTSDHSNVTVMEMSNVTHNHTILECNTISTAAILLADILPSLAMKLLAPLFINLISYRVKVTIIVVFAAASFLIVGLVNSVPLSILGVACASISSGLGEPVFLGLTAFFPGGVVSAWSSGTGGAGLFGALAYAGLTQIGVKPKTAVLMMLITTALLALSYFVILKKPKPQSPNTSNSEESLIIQEDVVSVAMTWRQKVHLMPSLLKYMWPLTLVYFAEYFINQGLLELLYFNGIWLSSSDQYRWYQVDYQLGVFISRSSVGLIHIKKIWIMPILQLLNAALLLTQVFFRFIPSFWVIMALVLYEGLIGGAAYVNTFFKIHSDMEGEKQKKEFSLTVVSIADTLGVCTSGAVSIPVHNAICRRHIKM